MVLSDELPCVLKNLYPVVTPVTLVRSTRLPKHAVVRFEFVPSRSENRKPIESSEYGRRGPLAISPMTPTPVMMPYHTPEKSTPTTPALIVEMRTDKFFTDTPKFVTPRSSTRITALFGPKLAAV